MENAEKKTAGNVKDAVEYVVEIEKMSTSYLCVYAVQRKNSDTLDNL